MPMTRQEIIDYAMHYIEGEEKNRFPMDGELFCFIERDTPADAILKEDEGWQFGGYGLCVDYELDSEAKPAGKWIWFRFLALSSFPPMIQMLKLQPPHIVKGRYQNPERTRETRIVAIPLDLMREAERETAAEPQGKSGAKKSSIAAKAKVLKFPGGSAS